MLNFFIEMLDILPHISLAILLLFVFDAVIAGAKRYKRNRIFTPYRILIVGVFVSAFSLIYPISVMASKQDAPASFIIAFFSSVQLSLKFFFTGGKIADITEILDGIENVSSAVYSTYSIYGGFLYFFAPMLSMGLVLSFFKNLRAQIRYSLSFGKEVHIFSEMNERSVAFAKSIAKKSEGKLFCRDLIVFAGVADGEKEEKLSLLEDANEIGAIIFHKDLASIKLTKRKHSVYIMGDNEFEKVRIARAIIKDYSSRPEDKMGLYIFSDSQLSKSFLDSYTEEEKKAIKMRVERINDIRFLIYNYLDLHGIELFKTAREIDGIREISVAVVGLGRYGIETVKALLWYCQMPGYRVRITAFERDKEAKSKFIAAFPSFVLGKDMFCNGDMKYRLDIIDGSNVGTKEFTDAICNMRSQLSHIFVCMGEDGRNLCAAVDIRRYLAKEGADITTVIYDSSLKERIDQPWEEEKDDEKEKAKKLHIIGDMCNFYAIDNIIGSELVETEGKQLNDSWNMTVDTWGVETEKVLESRKNFYMNDYNFYSSVSRALHLHLRRDIVAGKANIEKVFPMLSKSYCTDTDRSEYWYSFIIENTTSAKKAFMLKKALEETVSKLPEDAKTVFSENGKADIASLVKRYQNEKYPLAIRGGETLMMTISELVSLILAAADIEHVRWNAYMRSEGFSYGKKSIEHKLHHNIVKVSELSLYDCIKDV